MKLAVPNVASTMTQTLLSIVDFWIVSQLPYASEAQAAVSSAGMIFITMFALPLGTLTCVTTMVSQSLGAGRRRDCAAYAWQGIWSGMSFGTILLLLWPVLPSFYAWVGHEPAVQSMETDYTRIRLLSLGAAGAGVALDNFFNGIHRPAISFASALAGNVFNAVISYGLVLGKWGLPEMGVAGAAWGTAAASLLRSVCLIWAMCYGRTAAPYEPLRAWKPDWSKTIRLLRVGIPSGMAFLLDIGAWSMFLALIIGKFGTTHLAATAVVWRYLEASFMPAVGIGMAVSTAVGKAVGQGRPPLARRMTWIGLAINTTYMSLLALTFVLFGAQMIGFFNPEPAVITLGAQLLIFAAAFQFFDAIGITHSSALRGAGDTLWPSAVGALQVWTILFGGSLLVTWLRPEWGSYGPWAFATLFVICIGITLFIRWRLGTWEQMDVIGRKEPTFGYAEVPPLESALADTPSTPDWTASRD